MQPATAPGRSRRDRTIEETPGGDGTAATPDGTAATPDGTAATPDGTAATPDGTAATPDGTAATPDWTADAVARRAEYERFFTDAAGALVGQAYVLTGDVAEAQDLAQEALVQAWRNWERIRRYDDPTGWARRVVHNLAVSRWRRAELRRRHEQAEHVTVALSLSPEPPDAHLDLVAALGRLPVRHRQAVVLHDVVGLTAEEVGRELGVPASTVRAWLSRAHRRLEKEVEL